MTLETPVKYDTSSLRIAVCGGSPMTSVQYATMKKIFVHSKIICVYGMTEVGCATMFHSERDKELLDVKQPFSCGKPFNAIKLKVIPKLCFLNIRH